MWKQSYYPPYEESGFELPENHWRNGFIAFIFGAAAVFGLAYHVIRANDGFNHGFTEPAKVLKSTTMLTNAAIFPPTVTHIQDVTEVMGFEAILTSVKEYAKQVKAVKAKSKAPIKVPEIKPDPAPNHDVPVTGPRIGALGIYK